ncbi:excisionase family DNA-binding protein [Tessaracoccus palaemonis]|uniref:Excisionase family DNA-binding protein n=1 Tax=Tessaracoccus palaemonis TaxID=2829499 RepID=A0ABX8SJB4_9ACTN|nr:excisionase family DNA-binding protein [Tessaracoccus palaemonis]QXT63477.1 excisionase family DNA-binding protein [Tessaracoccus palaemonis]
MNTAAVAPDRRRKPISPSHSAEIALLARFVEREEAATPKLVGPDGESVALPEEIYRVLTMVVEEMRAGNAVSVVPVSQRIGTQEAAELLGISRPTLVRLLEGGEIPYDKPSRHRRLQLSDVLEYRDRSHSRAKETLNAMTAEASNLGLYDDDAVSYEEALRAAKNASKESGR